TTQSVSSQLKKLTAIAQLEANKKIETLTKQIISTNQTALSESHKTLIFKQTIPSDAIASLTKLPQAKIASLTSLLLTNLSKETSVVESIVRQTGITKPEVAQILTSLATHIDQPSNELISSIAKETGIHQQHVAAVTKALHSSLYGKTLPVDKDIKTTAQK